MKSVKTIHVHHLIHGNKFVCTGFGRKESFKLETGIVDIINAIDSANRFMRFHEISNLYEIDSYSILYDNSYVFILKELDNIDDLLQVNSPNN